MVVALSVMITFALIVFPDIQNGKNVDLDGLADVIIIEFIIAFVTELDITKFATYGLVPPLTVAVIVLNWPASISVFDIVIVGVSSDGFIVTALEVAWLALPRVFDAESRAFALNVHIPYTV